MVRARALRVARADVDAGAVRTPPPPGPDARAAERVRRAASWSCSRPTRWRSGSSPAPSTSSAPPTAWFRLRVPVVAGEEPSGLQRLAAAADFPNGIASELPWDEYVFINPDLTLYVEREPVGEWICLDAQMRRRGWRRRVLRGRPVRLAGTRRTVAAVAVRRAALSRRAGLLEAEGLDPHVVLLRVSAVDAVRERLDQRQQRGVRAHERGRVRRVVKTDPREPRHL